jgi:hypothetical protein
MGGQQGAGGGAGFDPCGDRSVGSSCNGATFPVCATEIVDGIPCCSLTKVCEAGVIQWSLGCTDRCAQNCELVTNPTHCGALGYCAWIGMTCVPYV